MIRFYTCIQNSVSSIELKELLVDIVGDMGRIHMRFLRNKNNYRTFIENIYYAMATMLSNISSITKMEDRVRVALKIGHNLKKMSSFPISSIFFEINPNFAIGIIE